MRIPNRGQFSRTLSAKSHRLPLVPVEFLEHPQKQLSFDRIQTDAFGRKV
jgi:hypothetical protein